MGMNTDLIRQRLKNLKAQTKKTSNIWKPEPGKTVVRIVPYKFQPDNPFIELFFHFEFGTKERRAPLSLKTFGEKDPIVDFCEKLKRTGKKEDWQLGAKNEPKIRTFVPIVVRGKELEGVKFWGFGKQIYEKLLSVAQNVDVWGDITDPDSGRDIEVEFKTKEEVGKDYPETQIQVLPNITPLTKNPELLGKLLDDQKEIYEVFPKPTYEELVEVLDSFLNPPEVVAGEEGDATPSATQKPKVAGAKPNIKTGTTDARTAFDNLFAKADASK